MRAVTPEQTEFNLGSHASNKEALAYLRSKGLDDAGTGLSDPQVDQSYWNTTLQCKRTWNGTIWEGHPEHDVSSSTVYVRSTGSDAGGDGSALDPYLTIEQAVEDGGRESTLYIDAQEDRDITLSKYTLGYPHCTYRLFGNTTFEEVLATTATTAIPRDRLLNQAADDAGRRITIAGLGAADHAYQFCMVEVMAATNAGMIGLRGWVIDNSGDDIWFDLYSTQYTDDGGTGLTAGDTIRIIRPSTRITCHGGVLYGVQSFIGDNWSFDDCYFWASDISLLLARHGSAAGCAIETTYGGIWTGGLNFYSPQFSFQSCAIHADFYARMLRPHVYVYGRWPNYEPSVIYDSSFYMTGVLQVGHQVALHMNSWWGADWPSGLALTAYDSSKTAADNYYIRFSHHQGFYVAPNRDRVPTASIVPHLIGTVQNRLISLTTDGGGMNGWSATLLGADVFVSGAPAYPNRCQINGVNDVYADPARNIEIIGTGNYDKKIGEMRSWVAQAGKPFASGMTGWNDGMNYAADNWGHANFVVPGEYIEGKQIACRGKYSTNDATAARLANMELTTRLQRDGSDDLTAPANTETTGEIEWPVSTAADVQETSPDMVLTAAAGVINGVAVEAGHVLAVEFGRSAAGATDDCVSTVNVYPDTIDVFMLGV